MKETAIIETKTAKVKVLNETEMNAFMNELYDLKCKALDGRTGIKYIASVEYLILKYYFDIEENELDQTTIDVLDGQKVSIRNLREEVSRVSYSNTIVERMVTSVEERYDIYKKNFTGSGLIINKIGSMFTELVSPILENPEIKDMIQTVINDTIMGFDTSVELNDNNNEIIENDGFEEK